MKHKRTVPFFIILFLYNSANVDAADKYMDEIDDEWQIVSNTTHTHENTEDEDDLMLSLKAFGNTAVSVLAGIGLNIMERTIQEKVDRFTSSMNSGLNFVGNSYGQGLALRNAYENEKQSLKDKN